MDTAASGGHTRCQPGGSRAADTVWLLFLQTGGWLLLLEAAAAATAAVWRCRMLMAAGATATDSGGSRGGRLMCYGGRATAAERRA